MKEKDLEKKQNIEIIILSVIIVILSGICIYLLFIRNSKNAEYKVIEGPSYEVYSCFDGKYEMFDKDVHLNYPLLNGETDSIKKLNERIKEIFNGTKEKYEKNYKKDNQTFCTFCIIKNNEYYCHDEMINPKYVIKESDKYLTLRISYFVGPACSSGYSEIEYYTILKEKEEVLTNQDILNEFNYKEEDLNKLMINYINKNHKEETVDLSLTTNNLKNKQYFIYNDKLYINYMVYDEFSYYEVLVYDGKEMIKVNDDFKNIFEK